MLDSTPTRPDMVHTIPKLGLQPSAVPDTHYSGYAPMWAHTPAATDAQVRAGALPTLLLTSTSSESHWWSGALSVTKDLAKGAYKEVTEHPLHIVESAAIGVGVGIGTTFAAPGVGLAVAAAGGAYVSYQLFKHAGSCIHDAQVVAHENDYGADQTAKAHASLEGMGAGAADIAAGIAGGMAANVISTALTRAAVSAGDGALSGSGLAADGVKAVEIAPAPQAPEPLNLQLQESIQANQNIFKAAVQDDAVVPSTKQAYNVRFDKVAEPTQIQTLEGLKTGTTETVKPGQWIATRLDSDGKPVIEKGIQNSWAITEKNMMKTYQIGPEDLQNTGNLVAATRTDAPPVHMVQLKEPLTITTGWGSMSGESGDWLANYDYAPAQPGHDYAIVTGTSYNQTYQPVVAPESLVGHAGKALFSLDDTTMTVTNSLNWALDVNANSKDSYGAGVLRFANGWATVMEKQIAAGRPLDKPMVDATERTADTEGITGFMYGCAKGALYHSWKYGAELKAILNPER